MHIMELNHLNGFLNQNDNQLNNIHLLLLHQTDLKTAKTGCVIASESL